MSDHWEKAYSSTCQTYTASPAEPVDLPAALDEAASGPEDRDGPVRRIFEEVIDD